jgi:hypothetical protein
LASNNGLASVNKTTNVVKRTPTKSFVVKNPINTQREDEKVKAFFEAYPNAEIDDLYTDSFNDKPLMDISKNVYLVKGNKIKKIK